jgi:hypothetical protein
MKTLKDKILDFVKKEWFLLVMITVISLIVILFAIS